MPRAGATGVRRAGKGAGTSPALPGGLGGITRPADKDRAPIGAADGSANVATAGWTPTHAQLVVEAVSSWSDAAKGRGALARGAEKLSETLAGDGGAGGSAPPAPLAMGKLDGRSHELEVAMAGNGSPPVKAVSRHADDCVTTSVTGQVTR